jgi:hypothetical protein
VRRPTAAEWPPAKKCPGGSGAKGRKRPVGRSEEDGPARGLSSAARPCRSRGSRRSSP